MEKIGLVTITYNSADVIRGFLESILKQSFKNFEIFIIDNDSQDDTEKVVFQYEDNRINFIKNSENVGVAKANNQGIKRALQANCSQVLIINNDIEFEDKLLEKMLSVQKQKKCSLVAPKMMYFDQPDHIWYAGSFFLKKKGYLPIHIGIQQKDEGQYDGVYPVEYAPTCCLLVRKKVFEDIGMMDEKYFVYFDDTDFLYRVFKDGRHKLYFFSDVKFYHKVGSLTKSVKNKQNNEFRGDFFIKQNTRNHIYFLKKIGSVYAYIFIVFLFIKNNLRIFTNPKIRCNYRTWKLINQSFFEGIKM
ncbi:MAG: glycosyl transferase [Flavobacteriales bacterium]|nr:glycosyl transferase [Flavobacteriales bacterium]|tara:strand:+ start:6101 stop:7009 length:909 start_codon:yes stop_codon:yes gene_type:complete